MHAATEALERQLQIARTLKAAIASVNAKSTATWSREGDQSRAEAYQWANDHALLGVAQPMYWTRETTEAVVAMAPTFSLSEIVCDRELLYCDVAFCWFEAPPLVLSLRSQGEIPLRALTWAFVASNPSRSLMISLTAYGVKDGTLQPVTWTSVQEGATLDSFGEPDAASGLSEAQLERWLNQCRDLFRFVVCAGTFLRQRIAVAENLVADRHARKRLAAAAWKGQSVVSIISLREREKRKGDDESSTEAPRQFQWQWMVRAHTRQQFYPSLGKRLPILIGPYIKGPEGKPLKPRTLPIISVDR